MVVLPLLIYFGLLCIGLKPEMAGTVSLVVALPGIELIPMLAKESGSDGDYAVGMVMVTTIASLFTLPLVSLGIALIGK